MQGEKDQRTYSHTQAMKDRQGYDMRNATQERLERMAEAIRKAGPGGVREGVLAWHFKLAASTLRTDYRRTLLAVFPDLRFEDDVYTSDPVRESEYVIAAVNGKIRTNGSAP